MARSPKKPALDFQNKLVLNQWMLSLFGVDDFKTLADDLKDEWLEGVDSDNVTNFCHHLASRVVAAGHLAKEDLLTFDANIVRHTNAIQGRRPQPITWKYFQYLSLLFTEIYLDRYFRDQNGLLDALNTHVAAFNEAKDAKDQIALYGRSDLTKLAFWNATGSGKTLIMHINILQFRHHMEKAGKARDFNRIILITPNEGLSRQHEEEFRISRIPAELFSKDSVGLYTGQSVEIIDISKLKEEGKEKTVSVDAFETNNLVLIDEGHRGASGKQWKEMRERLSKDGFSFEYSATFGQAVRALTGEQRIKLEQEYARGILFDYSYRYFYADGFGKDYRILNLADDHDEEVRRLYLTACLLSFYQQVAVQEQNEKTLRSFNVEKPLWIFVGSSVNSVRSSSGKKVSDVLDVLLFLAEFVKDRTASEAFISRLQSGRPGLLDGQGREVFDGTFTFLQDYMMTPAQVYEDVLKRVFNSPAAAALHVEELKGSDGEIALRLGDNDPFGVINVGDAASLRKLCDEYSSEGFVVSDRQFAGSYFHSLNDDGSTINMLIGSKKFTEGWNSWRVSTMGLMNIGRSEGSQIIQLFGRGIRLKGKNFSLKRHTAIPGEKRNEELHCLETLNVFGVRADYMQQFEAFLKEEGVSDGSDNEIINIPVVQNNWPKDKLKTIKLKDGLNYKKAPERPTLGPPESDRTHVTLDWYPRLEARSAGVLGGTRVATQKTGKLTATHVSMLNIESLYFSLQNFKAEKSWYNLNLNKEDIPELLNNPSWYTLYIEPSELDIRTWASIRRWQEIAEALLKKYAEVFYRYKKAEWEAPHLEYQELDPEKDGNFIDDWKISIDPSETHIIGMLKAIRDQLVDGNLKDYEVLSDKLLHFDHHLYSPLLYTDKNTTIKVAPVSLNEGERDFVEDLREFVERHRENTLAGSEVFLLRNMTRGRGVGFFEAGNFYPDFILWVLHGDKQQICFLDPKGIRNLKGPGDDKIGFARSIKALEEHLNDPSVHLHSYIIAGTPYSDVAHWNGGMSVEDFSELNVLFQNDDKAGYIGRVFESLL